MLATSWASAQEKAQDMGTFTLDTRLRVESAEQAGKKDADNLSARFRPGYLSPALYGLQFMAEGEFNLVADKNSYNAAGVHGDSDRAVIADPENTQLDQLWLAGAQNGLGAKVGRQVITLDNHRWIGHVGWRQNRQTFDAGTLTYTGVENLQLFYGYIDNVVRIFGDSAPSRGGNAEEFDAENHLVNISYDAKAAGKVTAYGYFLDMADAPGKIAGSDTLGVSYAATVPLTEDLPLSIHAELASQTDAGGNVQTYTAPYYHLKAGTVYQGIAIGAGYELLGSDRAGSDTNGAPVYASVQSPLATLHAFNGFADVFLNTPDKGLEDRYVSVGYSFGKESPIGALTATVIYHDFATDKGGDDLGDEIDAVLVKPFVIPALPGTMKFIAKYASYSAPSGGADLDRLIGEVNYALKF